MQTMQTSNRLNLQVLHDKVLDYYQMHDFLAIRQALWYLQKESHLLGIINDNKSQIYNLCKYTALNECNEYFCSRLLPRVVDKYFKLCDHYMRGLATCRIILYIDCSLSADVVFIRTCIKGCHLSFGKLHPLNSINLAFLAQFFDESDLADFNSHTLLPDPFKVTVPKLKIFEAGIIE